MLFRSMGLHDVYEPLDPPYRREIPIYKPSDRIGLPYVQVDPKKIIGVVEVNKPDEARSFTKPDPITDMIGQNVADFLAADMKRGIIPSTFLPLQSGVGNIANAVLGALGRNHTIPAFETSGGRYYHNNGSVEWQMTMSQSDKRTPVVTQTFE